jgi:ABC-2 type transport system permease protein
MRAYLAVCRKEFLESWRTYRLVILVVVFLFFGLLNVFTAKLMPDLLSGIDLGGGAVIQMPPATALDAWAQFFKNTSQMGLIVVVIVFCGLTAGEFSRGTLVNVLTKGLTRPSVVLAKFSVATLLWTLSFLVSLGVTWGYAVYFWGYGPLPHAAFAFICLWAFTVLIIALLILGGILFGSIPGALGVAIVTVIVLNLVNLAPGAHRFNPVSLAGGTVGLVNAQNTISDFLPALLICLAGIVAAMTASILVFNRKQM